VLLRLERKGVHVDTTGRRAGMVLERLHAVEVAALALREAVLAVELELGNLHRVLALALDARREDDLREEVVGRVLEHNRGVVATRADVRVQPRGTRQRGARLDAETREVRARGAITRRRWHRRGRTTAERAAAEHIHHDALRGEVVGVVEWLAAVHLNNRGLAGRAVDERVALDNPHKLLDGVVEIELDLVRRRRDGLSARELELLNQILVRLLREAAALLRVEVDVVNVERSGRQRLNRRGRRRTLVVDAVEPLLELDVDADLVVLEGNEGNRKTGVAAEPELQGNVQRLGWRAGAGSARVRQLRTRTGDIQRIALLVLHQDEVMRVADHVIERRDRARILRELRPDLHPVTVLAVNALAANLELNRLDEAVADVVEPAEARHRRERRRCKVHRGEDNLDIRAIHQVSVTVDDRRHTLVEVGLAVERHLNRLHREVGVALEEHLPERNLGIARNVDILRTIADKLKKTTTHLCLY